MKRLSAVACLAIGLAFVGSLPCEAQNDAVSPKATASKPILIGVRVEADGGGKGQGMWAQVASDLTARELKALETLVVAEINKQEGIKIVPSDYPEDYIGIVVVAAKLPNGNTGKWNYVAGSIVTVATKKGIDELVTHDVIAEHDLASLARAIAYQFATARFRAASGLWK